MDLADYDAVADHGTARSVMGDEAESGGPSGRSRSERPQIGAGRLIR